MSVVPGPRASDLAAQQVEQIVSSVEQAAEEIRHSAQLEQQQIRQRALKERDEIREEAQRDAEKMLEQVRVQALQLWKDAQREAETVLADARKESRRTREQTQGAIDGRVAAAERAAADVLAEARALSGGLRQLGKALEDHAERILRDVQAAHKRMQAELRIADVPSAGPAEATDTQTPPALQAAPKSAPARRAAANSRRGGMRSSGERGAAHAPARRSALDDLEVPSWVGRDP